MTSCYVNLYVSIRLTSGSDTFILIQGDMLPNDLVVRIRITIHYHEWYKTPYQLKKTFMNVNKETIEYAKI